MAGLKAKARPGALAGMARFGIPSRNRWGVAVPELRKLARKAGRNHALAAGLWRTGIPDARILASMVDEPGKVTSAQMEAWVRRFDSWDVCDQVCMNLFSRNPLAWRKARSWAGRREEFVRRAAFALMACLAWHEKDAPDRAFLPFLLLIRRASTDDRNFVKKAVNWALRGIGKRNRALNRAAIREARAIARLGSRSARWIAADALRELESEAVRKRLSR
jgi:3-methyladenine DNA glycosylase AlkD